MSIATMKREMREVLEENILPFWMERMVDRERGGFYGRMDGQGRLHREADKGAVLNARILWSFSAAYRVLGREEYLQMATSAKDYILTYFVDKEQGGVYWMLDCEGSPTDTKKQTYALGFMIYGLSEYHRATGDPEALQTAIQLYRDIEAHAYDPDGPGYAEALTRQWQPIGDMRLSDKDENASRTMNTHLHILEPYTNLYRVWPDGQLAQRLRTLVAIFTDKLLNPSTGHLDLFFDDRWRGRRDIASYGHDIEAAWLLTEALGVLGDAELEASALPAVDRIARASEEGLMADGSMIHESNTRTGLSDRDRHWWVQCECIIGEVDQWQRYRKSTSPGAQSRAAEALCRALRCWRYTLRHLVDWQGGEWLWSIRADGTPNLADDKAGPWKCPYHNSRLCLQLLERL